MRPLLLLGLCLTACVGADAPPAASPAQHLAATRAGASELQPRTLQPRTLEVGERDRRFLLFVPEACRGKRALPLVLMLHRRGGSAAQAARDYGMRELAEAAGFVVAYPEAPAPWAWSAGGLPLGDADADLAFLVQLLDTLTQELSIDPDRVYCCGHSSGGVMSYDLAAHVPDRIAAIGVVAGSIGARGQHGRVVPPGPAVSVVHVHGTADEQIPYDQAHAAGALFDFFTSAPDSVAAWAARNGCGEAVRSEANGGRHLIEHHPGGRDGTEVVLHTLLDGPHAWPTGLAAEGQTACDAAAVLWQFFAAHPKQRRTPRR